MTPSPSSIDNDIANNANNDINNESVPSPSSIDNDVDNNANNETNENIPVVSSIVNTTGKHNTSLKRLIQELKDEIKEDEERLERNKKIEVVTRCI